MIPTIKSLYNVPGWAAPITVTRKLIFSDSYNKKLTWNEPVSLDIEKRWKDWTYMFRENKNTAVPRTVRTYPGNKFKLHGLSDASIVGLYAAIYVVEYINTKSLPQHLLATKIKICTKRVKCTKAGIDSCSYGGEFAINYTRIIGKNFSIKSCHYWVYNTTVLYLFLTKGLWTVQIRNIIKKIKVLPNRDWKCIPVKENPSNLGRRGVKPERLTKFWYEGPSWLGNEEDWPIQPIVVKIKDAQAEILKITKKVMVP